MVMNDNEISMPCDWEEIIETWPEIKNDPMWDDEELEWVYDYIDNMAGDDEEEEHHCEIDWSQMDSASININELSGFGEACS